MMGTVMGKYFKRKNYMKIGMKKFRKEVQAKNCVLQTNLSI